MDDPNTATVTTGNMTSLLHSPDSYALRGKVMVTAIFFVLLTVVLLVLILQVYFRWYLHRRRAQLRRRNRRVRQQQQQHLNFATAPTSTTNEGLDPVVLNSLPVFTYSKSTSDDDEDYDDNDDETEVNCAVCLCEFDEGEKGKTLPGCNHSFHVECIDMWLQSHSTCPLCRAVVELRVGKDEVVVEMVGLTESCQHGSHGGPSSSEWNLAMLMDILNIGGCLMCDCGRGGSGAEDLESGRVVEDERRRSPAEQL